MYDNLLTNVDGCDSLVILDLTINYSDTTTTNITTCDSYIWLELLIQQVEYMIVCLPIVVAVIV